MFNKDDVGSGKVQSAADGRLEKSAEATKTRLHWVSLAAVLKRQRTALKCRRLPSSFYASAVFSNLCVGGLRWLRGWRGEHILLNVFGDRQINRKRGGTASLFWWKYTKIYIWIYMFGVILCGLFHCLVWIISLGLLGLWGLGVWAVVVYSVTYDGWHSYEFTAVCVEVWVIYWLTADDFDNTVYWVFFII